MGKDTRCSPTQLGPSTTRDLLPCSSAPRCEQRFVFPSLHGCCKHQRSHQPLFM